MKRHPTRPEGDDNPPEDKPLGRDERVSLYPLDPAEALRALLNTPVTTSEREKATDEVNRDR